MIGVLRSFGLVGRGVRPPDEWFERSSEVVEPVPAADAFTRHFTDPLYDDPSDELAPFGSDEGADLLATWEERSDELSEWSTVADVLEDDPDSYLGTGATEDAAAVRSAGFVLLRLTGHIDDAGRRAVLEALETLMGKGAFGDAPVLRRQRDDLRSWRG